MIRNCIGWVVLLFLAVVGACAAPLPEDAALDRVVTLSASEEPVESVLSVLAKGTRVSLAVDAHVAQSSRVTLHLNECALRDVLTALAAVQRAEWRVEEAGGYRLTGPALYPPAQADTPRLVARLTNACPFGLRPRPGDQPSYSGFPYGMPSSASLPPPMGAVYAALRGPLQDALEEGASIPFAQLPAVVRSQLTEYRRESTRRQLATTLNPRWYVSPELLGLRVQQFGEAGGQVQWSLVARDQQAPPARPPALPSPGRRPDLPPPPPAPSPWRQIESIRYQPRPGSVSVDPMPPPPPGERRVSDAALAVARKTGIGIVLTASSMLAVGESAGNTPEKMLASLLPEDARQRYVWKHAGNVYWLQYELPPELRPAPTPESQRARQLLEEGLPPEYRPLFEIDLAQRQSAISAPWARLWSLLTDEQRKPQAPNADPLLVSQLSQEQQMMLASALQLQMVSSVWSLLERALTGDLDRATLSMDFGDTFPSYYGFSLPQLGKSRALHVRDGESTLISGSPADLPPMLRLLTVTEPPLRKKVELELKDATLAAAAEKLSDLLGAPVVVEEPEKEVVLSFAMQRRPMLLALHVMERRTGLQWSKREGVYVLATPITAAQLTADPKRTMEAMSRDLPGRGEGSRYEAMTKSLTEEERARLREGAVPLSDMSPAFQDAVRDFMLSMVRSRVDAVDRDWQLLGRLPEARLRLERAGGNSFQLRVEVPGLSPQSIYIPGDDGVFLMR